MDSTKKEIRGENQKKEKALCLKIDGFDTWPLPLCRWFGGWSIALALVCACEP